jgi:hypothetical protein
MLRNSEIEVCRLASPCDCAQLFAKSPVTISPAMPASVYSSGDGRFEPGRCLLSMCQHSRFRYARSPRQKPLTIRRTVSVGSGSPRNVNSQDRTAPDFLLRQFGRNQGCGTKPHDVDQRYWSRQESGEALGCGDRIGTRAGSVCAHHCVCNPSVSVSLITSNATCEGGRDQNPAKFLPGLGHTVPHLASIRSVV